MSEALYSQVQRLYALLDLDGNGRIDREEARLGFSCCFADVHRDTERLSGDKAAIVEQQVTWLFSATEHAMDAEISYDDFKACYAKLLAAAYEEEVLLLDLHRAIDSLSNSPEWSAMGNLLQTAGAIVKAVAGEAPDAALMPSDARARAVLERAFADILGRSQVLGPKSQTAARRLVQPALAPNAPPMTAQGLASLFKQLLAAQVPVTLLNADAQQALILAEGAAAAPAAGQAAAAAAAPAAAPMDSQ